MAYWFQGFFAATEDETAIAEVCQVVRALWPEAIWRQIASPFRGIGVSRTADALEDHEMPERLDAQLGPWTRLFPALTVVRIEAVCFGGMCEYGGAVWRDGQLLHHEPDQDGEAPLIRLLRYLGVESHDGYFAPFLRGYFAPGHQS